MTAASPEDGVLASSRNQQISLLSEAGLDEGAAVTTGRESTVELLKRAFPNPKSETDTYVVMFLLCEYMSLRQLGASISESLRPEWEPATATALISRAPHEVAKNLERIHRVLRELIRAGLGEWIEESE
jgi:hypothetical protein